MDYIYVSASMVQYDSNIILVFMDFDIIGFQLKIERDEFGSTSAATFINNQINNNQIPVGIMIEKNQKLKNDWV